MSKIVRSTCVPAIFIYITFLKCFPHVLPCHREILEATFQDRTVFCMYVSLYVFMCVYVWYVYVFVCMYVYLCIYVCTNVQKINRIYKCKHTCENLYKL